MRVLTIILFVSAALSTTAFAQQQYTDRDLIDNFFTDAVEKVLQQSGYDPDIHWFSDPATIDITHSVSGEKITLRPNCHPKQSGKTGCPGLFILAKVQPTSLEKINEFNNFSHVVTAQLQKDPIQGDQVILKRYLMSDHGITFGTFKAGLAAVEQAMQIWPDFIELNSQEPAPQ